MNLRSVFYIFEDINDYLIFPLFLIILSVGLLYLLFLLVKYLKNKTKKQDYFNEKKKLIKNFWRWFFLSTFILFVNSFIHFLDSFIVYNYPDDVMYAPPPGSFPVLGFWERVFAFPIVLIVTSIILFIGLIVFIKRRVKKK